MKEKIALSCVSPFAPFAANLYNKGNSLGAFVDEKPCSIIQIKFLLAVF